MEVLSGSILVVDDEKPVCHFFQKIFERYGLSVYVCDSGVEALKLFDSYEFDVVLSDIHMPEVSGFLLLEEIQERNNNVPVIMVTGSYDLEAARKAMKLGAYDYIIKPFDQSEIFLSVSRAIEKRRLVKENLEYQEQLESIVNQRTRELQLTIMRLEDAFLENKKAHLESMVVLSKIVECNDEATGNHIKRISCYCECLAKAMGFSAKFVEEITYSSPMHDIGKILVDPAILKKPGKLTEEEFAQIKLHSAYGAQILEGVPFLQMARDIALAHHECYDGSGYPNGWAGEKIPIAARIVTICDVFDALISKRCYKDEVPFDKCIEIIESEIGTRFDPQVAEAFLRVKDEMYSIYLSLRDDLETMDTE